MSDFYKSLAARVPDTQYQDNIRYVLKHGELVRDNPQKDGAITCFAHMPRMVFDPRNGVPMITERSMAAFWEKPVGEIWAFANGETTIEGIESYGCKGFWSPYRGMGSELGLAPNDMGPGSYGSAFHDFPMPDGRTLNQFEQLLEQVRQYPGMRTHLVTPWIPFYTARGPNRKVIVAPCHGWLHVRIVNGRLHMRMDQRSGDMPLGVPNNMIQYAALHLALCQVTGYAPGNYVHIVSDAHIYENQVDMMHELVERRPRPFPIMRIDPSITDLFAFRREHFKIEEYDPHPAMKIPYSP